MFHWVTVLMALAGATAEPPTDPYAEGQVWEYRTRPGEEGSLLKIQRIEPYPNAPAGADGRVYHISIVGVRLGPQRGLTDLPHLPVSRITLDASVTRRSDSAAAFPDPGEGIAEWRAARGGVFTIPVAEIVGIADQATSLATMRLGDLPRRLRRSAAAPAIANQCAAECIQPEQGRG